jgi:tRNA 2-selenouridine synthase
MISIPEILDSLKDRVLIDVRTPAEYRQGHIPGARNMPLFSDEERVVVGTIYKQISREEAMLKGLEFVGPKMRFFVEEAGRLAPHGKIVVHCWRGGNRSASVAWLLEFAGFDVITLPGGYKAYRNHVLQSFSTPRHQLVILGGHTGSGKTEILHELKKLGRHVIDLEGLAHHKGSAFGALGEKPQPSVEQFENDLFQACMDIPAGARVWLENESRSIGKVFIPPDYWEQMLRSPLIHLEVPLDIRLRRLVEEYASFPKEDLADSFQRICKRLGGQHLDAALKALENGDFAAAAEIALRYYDKAYDMTFGRRKTDQIFHLDVCDFDPAGTAVKLLDFCRSKEVWGD